MNEIVPALISLMISSGINWLISFINSSLKYSPYDAFYDALLLILSEIELVENAFLM